MLKEAITGEWTHICVDMQLLFAPGEEWGLAWLPRVLPRVSRLCEADPARTYFTRFIPANRPGQGQGKWRSYYERWADLTLEARGGQLIELIPELASFVPPAAVIDKPIYSPWLGSDLNARLQEAHSSTVRITGGETDMCVLRRCSALLTGAIEPSW